MFWSLYQCLSPSKIALKRFDLYTKVWRWAVASLFLVYVCTFQTIFKDKHFLLRWPIILRPWVRIPSTPSILFSICNVEIGIGMRKGRKLTKKGPARTHIFLIEPCSGLSLGPIHKYFFQKHLAIGLALTHTLNDGEWVSKMYSKGIRFFPREFVLLSLGESDDWGTSLPRKVQPDPPPLTPPRVHLFGVV